MEEVREHPIAALSRDPSVLARYAARGASDAELADLLEVPLEEIARYAVLLRKQRAQLRDRVRSALFSAAEKGEPEALKMVARMYLGASATEDDATSE